MVRALLSHGRGHRFKSRVAHWLQVALNSKVRYLRVVRGAVCFPSRKTTIVVLRRSTMPRHVNIVPKYRKKTVGGKLLRRG